MSAAANALLGRLRLRKPEKPKHQKSSTEWVPSMSLKIGFLHLWMGRRESDERMLYLLLESIDEPRVMIKIHWLTEETPMFALSLYPTVAAFAFWLHSHDVYKGE
jgi:hypothetical protein